MFHDDEHVARVITKIFEDSSASHRRLDPAEGPQDAQLDDGARMHIVHADVGRDGHMLVNIRKFSGVLRRSLDELIALDMLDRPTASSCGGPNFAHMQTRPARSDRKEMDLRRLVAGFLRIAPDGAIVVRFGVSRGWWSNSADYVTSVVPIGCSSRQ